MRYDNEMVSLNAVHELIDFYEEEKEIELGKTYWASEWSWNPVCDGISPYEEIIRSHMVVDGIDVYFTNKNFRIYLKEDLYETKERCQKMCSWKNGFGYDFEGYVDRKRIVQKRLMSREFANEVTWTIK